jgi:hypothetical protein
MCLPCVKTANLFFSSFLIFMFSLCARTIIIGFTFDSRYGSTEPLVRDVSVGAFVHVTPVRVVCRAIVLLAILTAVPRSNSPVIFFRLFPDNRSLVYITKKKKKTIIFECHSKCFRRADNTTCLNGAIDEICFYRDTPVKQRYSHDCFFIVIYIRRVTAVQNTS